MLTQAHNANTVTHTHTQKPPASVRHNQQPGYTTLQTDDLWHQSFQCRWSSLLEHFTGLLEVIGPFV